MNDFKAAIEALPAKIDFIRKNICRSEYQFCRKHGDICLVERVLIRLADVNAYAVHPDHVAAAGILKDAKEGRACVDYDLRCSQ